MSGCAAIAAQKAASEPISTTTQHAFKGWRGPTTHLTPGTSPASRQPAHFACPARAFQDTVPARVTESWVNTLQPWRLQPLAGKKWHCVS